MKPLVIGTRGSLLALWQAKHIQSRLKNELNIDSTLEIIKTKGDKILDTPLSKIGGKGLFTKELEEALLHKSIDIAVHSLKDVPVSFPNGLVLAAITKRAQWQDCLLSTQYESISSLPFNAKVGTTSLRRSLQLKLIRSDLDTLSLRGNVQTRLQKLQNGEFDAIVLAKAALDRLEIDIKAEGLKVEILDSLIPAMGQGALGIECAQESDFLQSLQKLEDAQTSVCCLAEREFVTMLDGGCQVPIGVFATIIDESIHIKAIIGLPDGSVSMQDSAQVKLHLNANLAEQKISAQNLAQSLAKRMIANGAKELLAKAYDMAQNT